MTTLSIVIPCYNEQNTLRDCVDRVLGISDENLDLEIIIVDDASTDDSLSIAQQIGAKYPAVRVLTHSKNQGKGAALRTGFKEITGDFVAVQDADLEYDPNDLRRLLDPLISGDADVVFGSRFLSTGAHRVLYFWHSSGNKFITLLSNMFTDLNLSDIETCYKVFKREIIQAVDIEENRFGFEPEIVAKIAHMRVRVYEMGISYYGRTYAEGKKIGWKDGVHAIYCIFRYNAHHAPLPIQFMLYLLIGGTAAVFNLALFLGLYQNGVSVNIAAPVAFVLAAILNYILCVLVLFRRNVKWRIPDEFAIYASVVFCVAGIDLGVTQGLISLEVEVDTAKIVATGVGLFFNFVGRKYFVFPEPSSGPWRSQRQT